MFVNLSPVIIICIGSWISRSASSILCLNYYVFNIAYGFSAITAAASESRTFLLACSSLELVLLRSWTLRVCRYSMSWLCVGSFIIINIIVHSYILISLPRSIPIFWIWFSHVFCMSLAYFFSTYVNIELPKALDCPGFAFYFPVLAWFHLPVCFIFPILLPLPLPKQNSLPLSIVVDCFQSYWPCYLLNICTSTVSDLSLIFVITSGDPYLLFGTATVIWCLYLLSACSTISFVLVPVIWCFLLWFYVKDRLHVRCDVLLLLIYKYFRILYSITCFKLDNLQ